MLELLREFFLNAGVFKGTMRAALIGGGVAIAALPREVLGDAPSWIRIGGIALVAVGAFLRSTSQKRPKRPRKRNYAPDGRPIGDPGLPPAPPPPPPPPRRHVDETPEGGSA